MRWIACLASFPIRSQVISDPPPQPVFRTGPILSEPGLQMSKITLPQEPKMTDATAFETDPDKLVAEATGWAMALWRHAERLVGGGKERAMHRAAGMADVTPNTIWKLKYRPPQEIGASVYFKLKAAHQRHVESVEATVAENLEVLRTLPPTPERLRLVAQMEEFLRNSEGAAAGAVAAEVDAVAGNAVAE